VYVACEENLENSKNRVLLIKLPEIIILYNEQQTPTISGGKSVTVVEL